MTCHNAIGFCPTVPPGAADPTSIQPIIVNDNNMARQLATMRESAF